MAFFERPFLFWEVAVTGRNGRNIDDDDRKLSGRSLKNNNLFLLMGGSPGLVVEKTAFYVYWATFFYPLGDFLYTKGDFYSDPLVTQKLGHWL